MVLCKKPVRREACVGESTAMAKDTENNPTARWPDLSELVERARLIKSPGEVACLLKSAELAKAMADALITSARQVVREMEIYAHMLHANLSRRGEEDMIWIGSNAIRVIGGFGPTVRTSLSQRSGAVTGSMNSGLARALSSMCSTRGHSALASTARCRGAHDSVERKRWEVRCARD